MWIFLSVIVVCATILHWSNRYLTPVERAAQVTLQDIEDKDQPVNFDKVIAEIYDRLEEEP